MAKSVIQVFIDGDTKGIDRALGSTESKIGKFTKSAVKSFAVMGAAAIAGGVVIGKKLIDAGERASTANARILNITESMGLFGAEAQKVSGRLVTLAEKTALATGVDQNSIKATQAKLLTFKELAATADEVGGAFDRATGAAVDMAAAGFGDAESNAVQLGKALNDPIKGITALTRSGITFTAAEREMIQAMVDSGDMLGAQTMILEAIEKQVGGTAVATSNASDRMKVAFSQVQERLGLKLLPVFEKFTKFIIDKLFPAGERLANKWGPVLSNAFGSIGKAMSKVGDVVGKHLTPVLERVGKFFGENEQVVKTFFTVLAGGVVLGAVIALGAALAALLSPAVLITAGIAALVAGLQYAYKNFEGFRNVVDGTISFVAKIIGDFVENAQKAWEVFGDRILTHAKNTWDFISNQIKNAMKVIEGVIDVVMGLISGDWSRVWDGIKKVTQGVWNSITNMFRFAMRSIGLILDVAWENIKGVWRSTWSGLASWVTSTWNAIRSGVSSGVNAVVGFVAGLPGRVTRAVGSGFRSLWENFRKYANMIVDGWNRLEFTMPSVDTHIPGIGKVGGFTVGTPNIPRFDNGGVIPGPRGQEQLVVAHGGETVLPTHKTGMLAGANTINLTVNAGLGTDGRDVGRLIVEELQKYQRRNGPGSLP